jgi:hypothetical protein
MNITSYRDFGLCHSASHSLWNFLLESPLCQSNHKIQVIWKGRGGLLCYSPIFPLLRASCDRALRPCAYLANSKIGGNYYAQQKKMRDRGELNPRPRLCYYARRPSSASPTIKPRWYGMGERASYAIVQHFHPKLDGDHSIFFYSFWILIYTCADSFCKFKRQSSNFSSRFDFRLSTCWKVGRKY